MHTHVHALLSSGSSGTSDRVMCVRYTERASAMHPAAATGRSSGGVASPSAKLAADRWPMAHLLLPLQAAAGASSLSSGRWPGSGSRAARPWRSMRHPLPPLQLAAPRTPSPAHPRPHTPLPALHHTTSSAVSGGTCISCYGEPTSRQRQPRAKSPRNNAVLYMCQLAHQRMAVSVRCGQVATWLGQTPSARWYLVPQHVAGLLLELCRAEAEARVVLL
jgi:hypothetical protein